MKKISPGFEIAVYHCNFGLRGEESERDFRFCEALANSQDVPFFSTRVPAKARDSRTGESLQAWARRLRREDFARLASAGWTVATAHHLDDLAETVLMRLARGASAASLCGMKVWRAPVWRPLLGITKSDLRAYMIEHGHAWQEDSSNSTCDYARNRLRHEVMPVLESLWPGAAARIVATANEACSPADPVRHAIVAALPMDARLSRSLVDRLHAGRGEGAGRKVVLNPVTVAQVREGKLALHRHEQGLKVRRWRQHQRSLSPITLEALLGPGETLQTGPGFLIAPTVESSPKG